ncbi:recombinase [Bacteroides fragilis]|nr:recombinase [Bacteroides fragilis]RGN09339.1 recombinase [Bacteroides fragilis]
MVTETLQYFVFLCRSGYSAILSKCLIINDLRFILTILFFTAFLNITHVARHTAATVVFLANDVSMENVSKILGHSNIRMTQHYAKVLDSSIMRDMANVERNFLIK